MLACATFKAEKSMTFPSKAVPEDQAKPSMWIVRLLSLAATMLLIMAWAGSSAVAQTTPSMPLRRVRLPAQEFR
jgi:hypothetical protein